MSMRTRCQLALAGLVAALLMGLAAGSASAGRLSFSNSRFRITWENLRFQTEGGGVNPGIECPVTFEGSFHSGTIRKVPRALIGYVSRATVVGSQPPCTNGKVTILRESLPWHVTYEGFSGVLPAIESFDVMIHDIAVRISTLIIGREVICLYADRGGATEAMRGTFAREERSELTTFTPNNTIRMSQVSGMNCPPRLGFEREGEVFLLGAATGIRLTLI